MLQCVLQCVLQLLTSWHGLSYVQRMYVCLCDNRESESAKESHVFVCLQVLMTQKSLL